jgi:choline dehydrogenase-like flavoprotein
LGCGPAAFSLPAAFADLHGLRCDQVERWCPVPNMAAVHGATLRAASNLTVVTGATVVDLEIAGEAAAVTGVVVAGAGRRQRVPAPRVVLACGGVQTSRLLLTVQRRLPRRFGGSGGPLGRYYMGHVFGKVADIRLPRPQSFAQFDFFLHGGAYVRRRLTLPERVLVDNDLPNIAFALGNPRMSDPRHGSGVLSLLWTVLASPLGRRVLPDALRAIYVGPPPHRHAGHLRNMLAHIPSTVWGGMTVVRDKRFGWPRKPAVIFPNKAGLYALHFHAEQAPHAENRIVLSGATDPLGMPLPEVSLRAGDADAARIRRAHDVLAAALAESGIGRLSYQDADVATSILRQASDGLHQIGGVRMSASPGAGVGAADGRAHDVTNLYVVGSSVFPTAGNANPTFLAVALALRLADHLGRARAAAEAPRMAVADA